MKTKYLWVALTGLLFFQCDLEQEPQATVPKTAVFGSEAGLQLYTYSFYSILPQGSTRQDAMSDYMAIRAVPDFIRKDAFAPVLSSGWSWGDLRNINYFIVNNNDPKVPDEARRHYQGVARFFRAYFYFEKVVRFGDVPWINKPLDVADADLYGGRDPRKLVMDSVMADINYACANLRASDDPTRSLITKWVAYAFKSRLALFEGTFRKYHTELSLEGTANTWLNEAASAAKAVMEEGDYSINTNGGSGKSYRAVFTSPAPVDNEVILASVMDPTLNELNDANWYWTSGTYGDKASFTRTFINTYLNIDGTPFTDTPGWETMVFKDEVKGRDLRLKQTIRLGDYKRISENKEIPAPPLFTYTYTGYQPIKWTLDDMYYDTRDLNINSIPLIRYAEVLLNYAEAKAELGTLTDEDWAATVGVLRARGGITGGLTSKPTTIDPYLQSVYFGDVPATANSTGTPAITDPVILEIRRERGVELSLEGLRFKDLLRWKRGNLMALEWNGFYVPALNTPMDLNEDGIDDVVFYQGAKPDLGSALTYVDVSSTIAGKTNSQLLKNGTSGELTWLNNVPREWDDKMYYYPIPETDVLANPNLGQNPGW